MQLPELLGAEWSPERAVGRDDHIVLADERSEIDLAAISPWQCELLHLVADLHSASIIAPRGVSGVAGGRGCTGREWQLQTPPHKPGLLIFTVPHVSDDVHTNAVTVLGRLINGEADRRLPRFDHAFKRRVQKLVAGQITLSGEHLALQRDAPGDIQLDDRIGNTCCGRRPAVIKAKRDRTLPRPATADRCIAHRDAGVQGCVSGVCSSISGISARDCRHCKQAQHGGCRDQQWSGQLAWRRNRHSHGLSDCAAGTPDALVSQHARAYWYSAGGQDLTKCTRPGESDALTAGGGLLLWPVVDQEPTHAAPLVQGGSTLTQQLAKNLFLKPERTVERKIQELILAVWLETKFSKDEILELYLNRVYFGSGAYGVDAASRRYFNKSARDVNLAEAAILAGVLKAPSRLSPARNPQLAEDRAQVVLGAMRRADFVTDRETTKALTMQAKKAKRYWSGSEHYVADMVMKELPALIGEMRVDVVVDTTFDLSLQNLAGQIIAETLDEYGKKRTVSQGALVAMSPNGAIRALVGGREYADSQFNRATEAKRQPGSAFKPFVYLAALEAGRSPSSVRQDAPVKIGNWTPENYDRKYRGPVTLDTALAKSLNTVAAQLVMEVGPKTVVETAQRLGIRSKLQQNASIALGTSEVTLLELVTAFAPFSNGGEAASPFVIKRVKDLDGNILYEREAASSVKVVRSRELGMMNAMLSNVISSGTGRAASLGDRPAAGKTGTSQNSRDGLFIGYTADMIAGVWYGNDDGSPTQKVTGGSLPAKSWQRLMSKAHEGLPLSVLPGNYAPEVAAVPTVRPKIGISGGGGELDGVQSIGQSGNKRRTLSDIENPTPSVEVGQTSTRKRKTLLDLIFGG